MHRTFYSFDMKMLCRTLPAWAVLIACLPSMVHAQEDRTTVTGTVLDSANQPIDEVLVFIDGAVSPVLTGEVGAFRLEDITPGTYVLNLRKAGFAPRTFRLPITQDDGDRRDIGVIRLEPGGPEPTATVAGRVTDAVGGRPVRGAIVEVNGGMIAVTDADGFFNVLYVPLAWGSNELMVTHLSYDDANSDLWFVDPNELFAFDVVLIPVPVGILPEVVVEVDRTVMVYGRMRPFFERMATGLGEFITRREIEERSPTQLSDLFFGMPGVTLQPIGLTRVQITFTRAGRGFGEPCPSPDLYIDGALIQGGLFLNDILTPEQIEGIEVYRGTAETPVQFQKPGSTCGSIVIWTR